jgi:NAD+ diphosphatase
MSNDNVHPNFMSGSPLNRFAWLRSSAKFINACAASPQARWLLYRSGDPLVDKRLGNHIELPTRHVESILGPQPYFGQGRLEGESGPLDVKILESARLRGPTAIFLGVWENDDSDAETADNVKGHPYFAIDVSNVEGSLLEQVYAAGKATAMQASQNADVEMDYVSARAAASRFSRDHGAIFAAARAMLEWNSRTKVGTPFVRAGSWLV